MGRPRTEIGTYGEITILKIAASTYEARARIRLRNGRLKPVSRRGRGRPEAVRRLKKALATIADDIAGKTITGDSPMSRVMDLWLTGFEEKVLLGKRAHKSLYEYRGVVNNQLKPLIGDLSCREAENAGLLNEVLKDIRRTAAKNQKRATTGEAAMLRARTVLSNVCGVAVLHGAMKTNPVKSIEAIERSAEPVRALEPGERNDFLAKFRAAAEARVAGTSQRGDGPNRLGPRARAWLDLPELVEAMLSTGMRIGEALAVTGDDVDLVAAEVWVSHHIVRVEGVGMVRKPKRKGDRPGLRVPIVSWTAPMWRRRKLESGGIGPVFPAWNGRWLDPGNVGKRIHKICVEIGYGWVSSRYFRHTTATHLGDSDLTDTTISDALGNTPDVVRRHYRRQKLADPRIAAALETMLNEAEGRP